ncbi:17574_t:CDS:2, partial [Gigaspora rosea]
MQDHKTSIIECREYIKKEINSNTFQLFDYGEFKNKTYIREGAAGEIYKVERITNDKKNQKPRTFALKGFKGRLFRYIANGTLSNISLNTYIWKINDPDFQETSDATVCVPPEFFSIYNACLQIDPKKRPIVKQVYEALKKLQFDDFLHIEPFQHRLEDSMLLFVEQNHNNHSEPYFGSEILKHEESDNMSGYDYSDEEDCDGFVNILPKINSSSISSIASVSLASSQSSTLAQTSQQLISDKGYKLYIEGLKAKAKGFPRTAYEYFKTAAETGHPLARKQLARCYCDGYGVKKNTNEALRLFKLSTQGDDEYHLGICYEHGNGFKKDINIARMYYKEAELLGNQKAAKRLRHLDSEQS